MRLRHAHDAAVDYNPFAVAVHEGSAATYSGDRAAIDGARRWSPSQVHEGGTFVSAAEGAPDGPEPQLTCHYTSHVPWASRGAFLLATRQSLARVLVLDHDTPCAARDSGSVRDAEFHKRVAWKAAPRDVRWRRKRRR